MQFKFALANLLFLGCLQTGRAEASSLEISPVMVNLLPGQKVTTMVVTNRGEGAAAIQIRVYAWSQKEDEDVLAPTQDIIVSPPIFTVPKGMAQTIRLLLRGGTGVSGERSYRLLIDEVPPANIHSQQVAIAMRVSLPVIAVSAPTLSHKLQWQAKRGSGNQILLSGINSGKTHDKVQNIAVTLSDGTHAEATARGTNPYILAGARRHWVVQDGRVPTDILRLKVTTKAGKDEQILALAP